MIDAKLDEKLEPMKHDLAAIKTEQQKQGKNLHELTEDMADFFHKTWDKMDETDERVTIIEDHLGLSNLHKN